MKKFMLRRVGVSDDPSHGRPSLQDCLEAVLLQADTLVTDVLDGLAVSVAKTKGKSAYGDGVAVSKTVVDWLCAQAPAVKKTFSAQLRLGIYNSGSSDLAEQPQVRFDDLQLLDRKQIDASIEFAIAQQEIFRSVDEALPALNALVSSLLGWMTVQPQLNPLKPDVFVRALQTCLVQHVPDEGPRAALITPAAGLLGVSLRQLYREICDWLRSQGIEPATPVGVPIGGRGVGAAKGEENSVTRTMVTLDKLRKLLSGELDGAPPVMRDFLQTLPASFVAMEDMKLVEPMMKRLAARANLPVDVTEMPKKPAAGIAREKTQGKQLGLQLGEEVVRMMLDNLMQDTRLLLPVREVIQKLEPVLLVLSRSDPRFFSDRQHPARQFLDRVTHRSLGFASERDTGFLPFLKSISEAVTGLNQGDGEAAAFTLNLRKLEDGWAQDESVQRQQHEEAARTLLHAEQRNLLAQRMADDFHERVKGKDIPELVVGFLRGPWAQVVAQSQLTCADGSVDSEGYLALVDDFIWSVDIRLAKRNRVRLMQLLPNLLSKLRQGLNSIQYPPERVPVFFDALIALHEKAFEGHRVKPVIEPSADEQPVLQAMDADENAEQAPDEVASSQASPTSEFWLRHDEAKDSGYLAEEELPLTEGSQRPLSVGDLNVGVWVELLVEGAWLRAQLTWTSPHRTLFMFISHGGLAHSMSRRTMDRLLMQGSIRFVSDGHLVDNALDAVARMALQNDMGQQAKKI
ncbi:MAG: DUF1631 family protein [Rhodoferax sp.]|nr:DUF1631 family protein [Rhodoferax sp.]